MTRIDQTKDYKRQIMLFIARIYINISLLFSCRYYVV